MAKNDKRVKVTLACEVCKRRNYITMKNRTNDRERIEMQKYCRWDRHHTRRGPAAPSKRAAVRAPRREHSSGRLNVFAEPQAFASRWNRSQTRLSKNSNFRRRSVDSRSKTPTTPRFSRVFRQSVTVAARSKRAKRDRPEPPTQVTACESPAASLSRPAVSRPATRRPTPS